MFIPHVPWHWFPQRLTPLWLPLPPQLEPQPPLHPSLHGPQPNVHPMEQVVAQFPEHLFVQPTQALVQAPLQPPVHDIAHAPVHASEHPLSQDEAQAFWQPLEHEFWQLDLQPPPQPDPPHVAVHEELHDPEHAEHVEACALSLHPEPQDMEQVVMQLSEQVPEHPVQAPEHVPTHKPVQAPLQLEAAASISSVAKSSTCSITLVSNLSGKTSPCTTFTSPSMSVIFSNKSTVFCPCSALITPPATGCSMKSYADSPNCSKEPYPFLLAISAFTFCFNVFISSAVSMSSPPYRFCWNPCGSIPVLRYPTACGVHPQGRFVPIGSGGGHHDAAVRPGRDPFGSSVRQP